MPTTNERLAGWVFESVHGWFGYNNTQLSQKAIINALEANVMFRGEHGKKKSVNFDVPGHSTREEVEAVVFEAWRTYPRCHCNKCEPLP